MNCSKNSYHRASRFIAIALVILLGLGSMLTAQTPGVPLALQDTTVLASSDSLKPPKFALIKRDVNPRDQVLIGTTIMVFVIVVMGLMNNTNPE